MKDNYLTISEFSKISEISRKALIFYDNIGLFSPEYTAPNGYRYYSHEQIYVISVITLLKELGMPLSEIKFYMAPEAGFEPATNWLTANCATAALLRNNSFYAHERSK